jgi:hypothetical protein
MFRTRAIALCAVLCCGLAQAKRPEPYEVQTDLSLGYSFSWPSVGPRPAGTSAFIRPLNPNGDPGNACWFVVRAHSGGAARVLFASGGARMASPVSPLGWLGRTLYPHYECRTTHYDEATVGYAAGATWQVALALEGGQAKLTITAGAITTSLSVPASQGKSIGAQFGATFNGDDEPWRLPRTDQFTTVTPEHVPAWWEVVDKNGLWDRGREPRRLGLCRTVVEVNGVEVGRADRPTRFNPEWERPEVE